LDSPAVSGLPEPWSRVRAWDIDALVHLHVAGDPYPGAYAQGRTLRGSASTQGLRVESHRKEDGEGGTCIQTRLVSQTGLVCFHELIYRNGAPYLEIRTRIENPGTLRQEIEFLSAFSLGGITPFASDDAPNRLWVHRFRSAWSAEGRHEARSVEDLNLERSWIGHGVRSERFGQTGSLPVNTWFPWVGIEDRQAGVTWMVELATPGTWHLEIARTADTLVLGGGGADRLSGEWRKTLRPGEQFAAPPAFVTVAVGSVEPACDRLLAAHRDHALACPPRETDMPVIFNEWCFSWGHPTHDSIVRLADRLAGSGVRYLVIDDGWAERPENRFQQNGDWRVNRKAFPGGLEATAAAIRERGLIPGLWFEFEAVNAGSQAWAFTEHQLHRDGRPLQVGNRRFWDFRDPWVHAYLAERVIARLKDDGFGYLKVDCNDSIGPGVDGPESPGENLRQHLAGVQQFFVRLRAEIPGLVIENCSSGGHRLELSMMSLTAMSSFSDAHETPDIPIIAANLNSLVWSAQKQIWAVLRPSDTLDRLNYSLAAGFLGRLCLSGDVTALSEEAWNQVIDRIVFYRSVVPILREGVFRRVREGGRAWQHVEGTQICTVSSRDEKSVLMVWHCFTRPDQALVVSLPKISGVWTLAKSFGEGSPMELVNSAESGGPYLQWMPPTAGSGGVALLLAGPV
ncbi:MAG TPA: alpha-galactosidase, partial [Opitutaceae bacterium]|nr:alpha-galactosidase [Opitutaceae bacterium]